MTPHDPLQEYQRQQPLRVGAQEVWRREESANTVYGLKFRNLTVAQEQRLEDCFDYFDKNPRYPTAEGQGESAKAAVAGRW
jgi:methyl-accepting chemotaxis protein